jgi:hypothetical protein
VSGKNVLAGRKMWPKFAHLIWIGLGPQKFGAINMETSLTRNILMHFTLFLRIYRTAM